MCFLPAIILVVPSKLKTQFAIKKILYKHAVTVRNTSHSWFKIRFFAFKIYFILLDWADQLRADYKYLEFLKGYYICVALFVALIREQNVAFSIKFAVAHQFLLEKYLLPS